MTSIDEAAVHKGRTPLWAERQTSCRLFYSPRLDAAITTARWPRSRAAQAAGRVASLEQRVVGTVEHVLRLGQRVDLIGARGLAHVVILQKPVALVVHVGQHLLDLHELLA